jgi:hypothetical protein
LNGENLGQNEYPEISDGQNVDVKVAHDVYNQQEFRCSNVLKRELEGDKGFADENDHGRQSGHPADYRCENDC